MFPCRYAPSTRSASELVSNRAIRALEGRTPASLEAYLDDSTEQYRNMVEWIRRDLNPTSLKYLPIQEMINAIGLPAEQLCLYCWRGR
jgi:amidophosphoribosyltransferase